MSVIEISNESFEAGQVGHLLRPANDFLAQLEDQHNKLSRSIAQFKEASEFQLNILASGYSYWKASAQRYKQSSHSLGMIVKKMNVDKAAETVDHTSPAPSAAAPARMVNGFTPPHSEAEQPERPDKRSRPTSRSTTRSATGRTPAQAGVRPAKRSKHRNTPIDPCFSTNSPPITRTHSRSRSSSRTQSYPSGDRYIAPSSHQRAPSPASHVQVPPYLGLRPASRSREHPPHLAQPAFAMTPEVYEPPRDEVTLSARPSGEFERPTPTLPPRSGASSPRPGPSANSTRTSQGSGVRMMEILPHMIQPPPAQEGAAKATAVQPDLPGASDRKAIRAANKKNQANIEAEVDDLILSGGPAPASAPSRTPSRAEKVAGWKENFVYDPNRRSSPAPGLRPVSRPGSRAGSATRSSTNALYGSMAPSSILLRPGLVEPERPVTRPVSPVVLPSPRVPKTLPGPPNGVIRPTPVLGTASLMARARAPVSQLSRAGTPKIAGSGVFGRGSGSGVFGGRSGPPEGPPVASPQMSERSGAERVSSRPGSRAVESKR